MSRRLLSENSLLAKIARGVRSPSAGKIPRATAGVASRLALGLGDDAALFRPSRDCETILTCDWFLQGTHFLPDKHPADSVGWKCLARAVSDIAAMGGTPRCFLLSLALPDSSTGSWLDAFLRGLRRAEKHFDCMLAGGDTTRRHEILINVTVIGEVPAGRALRRDGAQAGDLLYVSGVLGEAERGLRLLRARKKTMSRDSHSRSPKDPRLQKHLYPEPRLALGELLGKRRIATAAMDLSDGLSSDLPRLCAASGVGARIDAAKLPVPAISLGTRAARHHAKRAHGEDALLLALHGGDDYELLFTVPKRKELQVPPSFLGVPLTAIGEITATRKILLVGTGPQASALKPGGWDPFR
jgi:thiamine-monophosphate kinase